MGLGLLVEVYLDAEVDVEPERMSHVDVVVSPIVEIIGSTRLKIDSNPIGHIVLQAELSECRELRTSVSKLPISEYFKIGFFAQFAFQIKFYHCPSACIE